MATPIDEARDTGINDRSQHTGNEHTQNDIPQGPSVADSSAPISLNHRAPAGPIATRTWNMYARYGLGLMEYENLLEQKNQCIRSRLAHLSRRNKLGLNVRFETISAGVSREIAKESTGFPYPSAFQKILQAQQAQAQVYAGDRDEEHGVGNVGDDAAPGQDCVTLENAPEPIDQHASGHRITYHERREWVLGFRTRWFGLTRTTAIESETYVQPMYVVLGIFPRGHSNPRERVVFIHKPKWLFWRLRWTAFRLRGWRSTLFSLRHVKGFRLYRCDHEAGTHSRITLDRNSVADLQLLLDTYKRFHVPSYIAHAWANWIHQTMNNKSHDVLKGTYALELVLDWSVNRISVVVLLPVLLSLGIGLWLNAGNWTDLATIQTAWGTASYVVTAGGLLAALLGILSSIADK